MPMSFSQSPTVHLGSLKNPLSASRCLVSKSEGVFFVIPQTHGGSFFEPRATILSEPSGNGRCNFNASSVGAVIHVSISSGVVENDRHGLGMNGSHLFIRLGREEGKQVIHRFAFLDLAH